MKLSIWVRKDEIIQYLLIYFMLLMNQSVFEQQYIGTAVQAGIVVCILAIMFIAPRFAEKRTLYFIAFILLFTFVVRLISGGIGITSWFQWASIILVTLVAVRFSTKNFVDRFLNFAIFMAVCSLIGFTWQIIDINSLRRLMMVHGKLAQTYTEYSYFQNDVTKTLVQYPFDGLIFYVVNGSHTGRNVGIYTEPGIYQMVINTAIYLLLFCENNFSWRKKRNSLIILIATIVSIQSATGFLGLILILLAYSFNRRRELEEENGKSLRRYVAWIIGLGVLAVLAEYMLRGSESFIYRLLILKIMESFGVTNIAVTSGGARLGMILTCLKIMLTRPWGIGFDGTQAAIQMEVSRFAGAAIMEYGAALGVIPFVGTFYWFYSPVLRNRRINRIEKILIIGLFLNTLFAQSSPFYPTLIMLPMYFYATRLNTVETENFMRETKSAWPNTHT